MSSPLRASDLPGFYCGGLDVALGPVSGSPEAEEKETLIHPPHPTHLSNPSNLMEEDPVSPITFKRSQTMAVLSPLLPESLFSRLVRYVASWETRLCRLAKGRMDGWTGIQ